MATITESHEAYANRVAREIASVVSDLTGVYLGGSLALGDYVPARSDIDIAAVAAGPQPRAVTTGIVEAIRHEVLPCPARGLEFVLYTEAVAGGGGIEPGYELDLNTGERMPFRASFDPGEAEPHWYALDRAVLAAHGRALLGPPAAEVFVAAPRDVLVGLLAETIRWHARGGAREDAVLNAARAVRFARTGEWSSKQAAGEWAVRALAYGALAGDALRARRSGTRLSPDGVRSFLDEALSELASR